LHQRVVAVVVLGVELAAPPLESELDELDGEVLLSELELGLLELELELEPLPPVPGPPIELVLPLLGDELELLLAVSLLVLPLVLGVLGAVLAVLGLVGAVVLLEELDEPGVALEPVVASRLVQAPRDRAAATARVAAAHWVRDIFIRNS
jgi:hypothetical protein